MKIEIKPKTILIITDNTQDQINGVVTTFKNIVLAAPKYFKFEFITPDNFTSFSAPGYPEVKLSLPFSIGEQIKAISPDFIHIATEGPIGIAAKLYLDKNKLNYNSSYHTKFPEFLNMLYGIPFSWTNKFLNWFHRKSKTVLTTTPSMVESLKLILDNDRIIPWTRGIDRKNLSPTITRPLNKSLHLLYVGRVSKEKNLDELCELSKLYNITIVGDGPYRKDLELRYPKIKFLGYLAGSELANEYLKADVFVFPSKTDTFGIVMIEAMSLGTPVAAFPVQGPLDVIDQDFTGFMHENLRYAIVRASLLPRSDIKEISSKWTWELCWRIFYLNLNSL